MAIPSFINSDKLIAPNDDDDSDDTYGPTEKDIARMSGCGKWYLCIDPKTGGLQQVTYHCNVMWCKTCCFARAEAERCLLEESEELYRIEVAEDEWQATAKHLQRQGIVYRRYPHSDGSVTIFTASVTERLAQDAVKVDAEAVDLPLLLLQTEGAGNITGKLGTSGEKAQKTKSEEETVKVSMPMLITDGTLKQRQAAWDIAVDETSECDPHTQKELQSAINKRMRAFIRQLKNAGVKIIHRRIRTIHVQISLVDWSNTREIRTLELLPGELPGVKSGQSAVVESTAGRELRCFYTKENE